MAAKKKSVKKKTAAKKAVKKVVKKKTPAGKKVVRKKTAVKTAPGKKRVTFTLDAPHAGTVAVVGTFNSWDPSKGEMKKNKAGAWKKIMNLAPGEYEYKFLVDDNWIPDPACGETVQNPHGTQNSLLRVG